MRVWVLIAGLLALAGCGGAPRPVAVAPAAPASAAARPERAANVGVVRLEWSALAGWPGAGLDEARRAFRASCPALLRREDRSGLTAAGDWAAACAAAAADGDARAFFEGAFVGVTVAGGEGFTTGYFEPELAGSRAAGPGFPHPLYRTPPDLIEADLGAWSESLKGRRVRGRVDGTKLVPYQDRAAIEAGALKGRGLELGWAADPYELFFLHIQGSGRLRLPDGTVMRVGYAGQNGRDYTAVGKLLRDRGALGPGQATMEGILGWMRAHRADAVALMNENKSFVFFRELTGPGPLGAMGVALTPEASLAADPLFVPLGAPVFLATQTSEGAWARAGVAQDTGGAIKGANRFDIFFGAGERARALAGTQSGKARAYILLPRVAAERHGAR